jgi:hypothetical protein
VEAPTTAIPWGEKYGAREAGESGMGDYIIQDDDYMIDFMDKETQSIKLWVETISDNCTCKYGIVCTQWN